MKNEKPKLGADNIVEESIALHEELLEDCFFLAYHLHQPVADVMALPVYQRKWLIARFEHEKSKELKRLRRK